LAGSLLGALLPILTGCNPDRRSVHGLELTSPADPRVRITVQPRFTYVGRFSYSLGRDFDGERFVFAPVTDSALPRLFVVQFERIKPPSAERYRYNVDAGEQIGPLRFVRNSFAFDNPGAPVASPHDEGELTSNFLLARGFRLPSVWLASRFVTIGGPERTSELIIFYMEGRSDLTLKDLYVGEDPTETWQALKPALAERARAAFELK
jgi:hypothetical protein